MGFPLYLVVAFVLILIVLAEFTYLVYRYYQAVQCESDATAWCWSDWVCKNDCPSASSPCYDTASKPGLAKCLYGPASFSTEGCETGEGVCACPTAEGGGSNCLTGCPLSLKDVASGVACCTADNPC